MKIKNFFQTQKIKIKLYLNRVKSRRIDSSLVNMDYLDNSYRNENSNITKDDTFFGLLRKAHTSDS